MNEIATILAKSQMSKDDIQQVITIIDQESANLIYRKCAEEFGFKVVTIEGNIYSTASELHQPLGYSQRRNVSNKLRRNQIETFSWRQIDANKMSGTLVFDPRAHKTQLIDYRGFLALSVQGKGDNCDKVREYLMKMERKARVDTTVYKTTGMDTIDFQEIGKYADDPVMQSMLEGQKRMKEIMHLRAQQLETQARVKIIETKVDAELSLTSEQEHVLNKMRDELISLQVKNGKDQHKAYQQFYRNIKGRYRLGIYTGMERSKFPLAVDYIKGLIQQEQAKLNQLIMF